MMSASFAASSTSHSDAPAMKSATTASTAIPHPSMKMPVCPVATNLVRWPRAAGPQHLLRGLPGLRPVEHPDDPLGHVADAAVGRFGRHGLELPVGDDQEAMIVRSGHQAAVGVLGVRNSDVVRSTAGSKRSASP